MRVLSLFDGMSCGKVALERLGKDCEYFASEIDKYAIKVSEANHPDITRLGDVSNWREWDIDWNFDILMGGSPCQGFSKAGKGLGMDDPRSKLFFDFVDILAHIRKVNPNVKFLLENVMMKQDWIDIITEYMGVQPILINSNLVSAQNRRRYYWTNIQGVGQPEDKNILLQDILEKGWADREKAHTICATYYKGSTLRSYFMKHQRQIVFDRPMAGRFVNRKYRDGTDIRDDKNGVQQTRCEPRLDEKTECLTTIPKTMIVLIPLSDDGEEVGWRHLSPLECERLQTLPDGYTDHDLSKTQRYKMLGNGWTVDVIKHILGHMDRTQMEWI
jgi:DNA-cytosine methyltransferase